jgi:hypothetical protein
MSGEREAQSRPRGCITDRHKPEISAGHQQPIGEPKANRLHCDQFTFMGTMGYARNTEGAKEARKEH